MNKTTSLKPLCILVLSSLSILGISACKEKEATTTNVSEAFLTSTKPLNTSESGTKKISAEDFILSVNKQYDKANIEMNAAQWVRMTYITDDTALLASTAYEKYMAMEKDIQARARHYSIEDASPDTAKALINLTRGQTILPPDAAEDRAKLAQISTKMEGAYGAGKYCTDSEDETTCRELGELSNVLRDSRDYDEQLDAWVGWRTISPPFRKDYEEFVRIANAGAQSYGFNNLGDSWKSGYDMPAAQFEADTENLWQQVKPLYEQLHCYTRGKLSDYYGIDKVPANGPIPAHLLGNMWSQSWKEIYDILEPYPGVSSIDVTAALVEQNKDAIEITQMAENFFVSLGMQKLPESFWKKSMLTKPRDRDVVCHASAWSMDGKNDVRIKQCVEPTDEEFTTIHHELGHIYYDLAYNQQPALFQSGAHDGFHEAIGDTIALSLTPSYMQEIGLIKEVTKSEKATINQQMQMALEKIAFLPFGKMIDQWRWGVFSGDIAPQDYNKAWWDLRTQYQGIKAPVERTEADFDPGAKYHIPGNTPYTRYFLAHILQFQFHKALCKAAGHTGSLNECSIYNNKKAGDMLMKVLSAGASKPWQDTLENAIGARNMDASAITEYFAPLNTWLVEQNKGQSCGW